MSSPDSDPLSRKLRAWQVSPALPRDFQAQVWHRIALRQEAMAATPWARCLAALNHFAARPAFALAAIALSTWLGVTVAQMQSTHDRAVVWHELEIRYHDSINPVTQPLVAAN